MHSLGKRISPVQLRVGAPISQSSQRSSRSHTPAVSRAALETATVSASTQQPADFFCKEFLPGQHRLEDPFPERGDGVLELWSYGAATADKRFLITPTLHYSSPPIRCPESKPQQTGTGLLIRYGEVATTSGSTKLRTGVMECWIVGVLRDPGLCSQQSITPPIHYPISSCLVV